MAADEELSVQFPGRYCVAEVARIGSSIGSGLSCYGQR